ncbi:MAG: NUDIX hydrolase [Acidilobaceae archaeon]
MTICRGRRVYFESSYETLPNGVSILIDRVIFPNSVAILPVFRGEERIVLIRQYRPTIKKWILEAPAGTLREGEDPIEAAKRELEEEAGLRAVNIEEVGGGYVSPGYSTEYLKLYIAWDPLEGRISREQHEVIDKVVSLDMREAYRMISRGEIEDIKTILLIHTVILRLNKQ